MVIEIMKDMGSFMIILIFWIIGLSVVFFIFEKESAMSNHKVTTMLIENIALTYRLAFGDFETEDYSAFEWIVFILASLFIPLVMFNMLIAIMGDTY